MSDDLFKNRSADPDTVIIKEQREKIDSLDVLLEAWIFDGIFGQSAVLLENQVKDLSDEEIIARLSKEIDFEEEFVVSRKGAGYVFVNYGFRDA